MDDEPHAFPSAESTAKSDQGLGGGTYNAAIVNRTSGDINMFGCTTTSNFTFTSAPVEHSDFRRIPLGDIDLRKIHFESGSVRAWRAQRWVRRVYAAKIEGRRSGVTVATYQGDGAEEEWRRDLGRYMSIRHPNIVQLWGTASTGNIHATIFHDDLILLDECMELSQHSHFSMVYYHACGISGFTAAQEYFESTFQYYLDEADCTLWMRRSTGHCCVEPAQCGYWWGVEMMSNRPNPQAIRSLDVTNPGATIVDSLTLHQYHDICYWRLRRERFVRLSNSVTVNTRAVLFCSSGDHLQDSLVEIAFLPNVEFGKSSGDYCGPSIHRREMEDGWTRFNAVELRPTSESVHEHSPLLSAKETPYVAYRKFTRRKEAKSWLSQANYIFSRLNISSSFDDYFDLDRIDFLFNFNFKTAATTTDPTNGYLFLCPSTDFQTGPTSLRWPDSPAYWSLDPSGAERLSMDRANQLGFPSLYFRTEISGDFWDTSVYEGLRQFHQGKGFDPDSQDLALHLGQPLYQLCGDTNAPFAHIDDEYSCAENDSSEITVQNALEGAENGSGETDARYTIPEKLAAEDTYENIKGQKMKDAAQGNAKRTAEDTPENSKKQKMADTTQDNLALRRLMLDEKMQLIEMYKLGIYTKEEFIAKVAKIEARYEAGGTA